jgi:hypothetical protein
MDDRLELDRRGMIEAMTSDQKPATMIAPNGQAGAHRPQPRHNPG